VARNLGRCGHFAEPTAARRQHFVDGGFGRIHLGNLMRTFAIMDAESLAFTEVAFDCGCGSGVVVIWVKMIFNSSVILACVVAGFSRRKAAPLTPPSPIKG